MDPPTAYFPLILMYTPWSTSFSLNRILPLTEDVLKMTEFVVNLTAYLLNITWLVLNIIGFDESIMMNTVMLVSILKLTKGLRFFLMLYDLKIWGYSIWFRKSRSPGLVKWIVSIIYSSTVMSEYHKTDMNKYPNIFGCNIFTKQISEYIRTPEIEQIQKQIIFEGHFF